jgi:hypothetical protein
MARNPLLTAWFVAAALGATGCSSAGGSTGKGIPRDAATALAGRADGVATALSVGDCEQALAQARSLQADLATLKAAPAVRTAAADRAARLVAGISCPPAAPPPPPVTTTAPVVVVPPQFLDGGAPWPRNGKGHKGGHEGDD